MSYFYGLGSSDFFGQSFNTGTSGYMNSASSTSGSFSLGDWSMIKSGSYKKLLTAYYTSDAYTSENSVSSKKDTLEKSKQDMVIANDANSLVNKTNQITNLLNKYATQLRVASGEEKERLTKDLQKVAEEYVNTYNSMLDSVALSDNNSILRNGVSITRNTNANKDLFEKLGITVGSDNKLTLDEEKFKEADMNVLTTLFKGQGSYASHITRAAGIIKNISTASVANANKASSYTSSGSFVNMTGTISSYNSKI